MRKMKISGEKRKMKISGEKKSIVVNIFSALRRNTVSMKQELHILKRNIKRLKRLLRSKEYDYRKNFLFKGWKINVRKSPRKQNKNMKDREQERKGKKTKELSLDIQELRTGVVKGEKR